MSSLSRRFGIVAALTGLLAWASSSFAGNPGTRPYGVALNRAAKAPSSSLRSIITEVGRIGVSMDGAGTLAESSAVQVEKPSGATVRRALLIAASAGFSGHHVANGEITIDGAGVSWDTEVATALHSFNYLTEVTSLVAAKLDGAPAGRVGFTIREASPLDVDGVALVVIFNDSAQTEDVTVTLFFGAQSTEGDHFSVGLASPLDTSDPSLRFDLSLGISFGYQSPTAVDQFSVVDVNGARLTSSAGGQDDGAGAAGALFTLGCSVRGRC